MNDLQSKRDELLKKIRNEQLFFKIFKVDYRLLAPQDSKSRVIEDEEFSSLRKSIKLDPDFLRVRFPVVNMYEGREWMVIAGDKRVKAALAEGMVDGPVMFVSIPKDKEKEWMIKDNKHSGRWDDIELQKELIELHETGYNMESLSFTPTELTPYFNGAIEKRDPKRDPENKGTTPRKKGKAQIGAKVECPNCKCVFGFAEEHIIEETE